MIFLSRGTRYQKIISLNKHRRRLDICRLICNRTHLGTDFPEDLRQCLHKISLQLKEGLLRLRSICSQETHRGH